MNGDVARSADQAPDERKNPADLRPLLKDLAFAIFFREAEEVDVRHWEVFRGEGPAQLLYHHGGGAPGLQSLPQGRAVPERMVGRHHRHPVPAEALVHPLDDLVAAVPRQVDIDVGPRRFPPVKEALEEKTVRKRINRRGAKEVEGEGAHRRPAHHDGDPFPAAVGKDFCDDEHEGGETEGVEDPKLLLQAPPVGFRPPPALGKEVADRLMAEIPKPLRGGRLSGEIEGGRDAFTPQVEAAFLRNFRCRLDRLGDVAEERRRLFGRAKAAFPAFHLAPARHLPHRTPQPYRPLEDVQGVILLPQENGIQIGDETNPQSCGRPSQLRLAGRHTRAHQKESEPMMGKIP